MIYFETLYSSIIIEMKRFIEVGNEKFQNSKMFTLVLIYLNENLGSSISHRIRD